MKGRIRIQAGGGQISDHYTVAGNRARFRRELQRNVTWARHNLVTDGSFNEFHLILCANVLIYFKPALQERAHRLFFDSLIRSGYLALGERESLIFCPERSRYERVRDGVSLFQKVRWRQFLAPDRRITARPRATVDILLVDDDPKKRFVIKTILEPLGENVVEASPRGGRIAPAAAPGVRSHSARRSYARDGWV